MPKRKYIEDYTKDDIVSCYNNGMTQVAISNMYDDMSPKLVKRVLREAGVKTDSNRGNGNASSISEKDESIICAMYETGLYSIRDLSKEYNVSGQTIKKVLSKNCIEIDSDRKRVHGMCKEILIKEYDRGYSLNGLSQKYGIDGNTIKRELVKNDIEIKTHYNISSGELEIVDYIKSIYDGEIVLSSRQLICPLEIDIYIPKFKLGIEYHGDYFHSEIFKDRNFHKLKHDKCMDAGIHLIQIFESEYKQKRDIINNMIKHRLHIREDVVYARKCDVFFDYDKDKIRKFMDDNHIQGRCPYSLSVSLLYNTNLVASMLFKKSGDAYDLVRFCSANSVVGGFSRCLKNGIKEYSMSHITSFADLRVVNKNDNVYETNGFLPIKEIPPDYKYIYNGIQKHKFGFRHAGLKTKLENYDPHISEHKNCLNNGIYQVYDSGKMKYELKQQKENGNA